MALRCRTRIFEGKLSEARIWLDMEICVTEPSRREWPTQELSTTRVLAEVPHLRFIRDPPR